MSTTYLALSWSTSRGRDTYGWNIVRLDDTSTHKRYRANGGGYDMVGTVFADWLQDVHQGALQKISDRAAVVYRTPCSFGDDGLPYVRNEAGLYGMHVTGGGQVRLDGACGLESIRRVAEAIGLSVRTTSNRRGRTTGFIVEQPDAAGCSCTSDPDTGELYDADGFPCAHDA